MHKITGYISTHNKKRPSLKISRHLIGRACFEDKILCLLIEKWSSRDLAGCNLH